MNTPMVFSGQSGSILFTAVTHTETQLAPVIVPPEHDCLSSMSAHARTSEGQTQAELSDHKHVCVQERDTAELSDYECMCVCA